MFTCPPEKLYFATHLLGLMPKSTNKRVNEICNNWDTLAEEAWPIWIPLEESLIDNLARVMNVPRT